jgi:hypothetical protein
LDDVSRHANNVKKQNEKVNFKFYKKTSDG